MPSHLPAFLVTTWLLAMLPGAGQAVMIRQVLAGGLRTARGTIAGNAAGLLLWSMAAAAGLSAVLLASPRAYAAVRILGGVVLVVLGVRTLTAARPAASSSSSVGDAESPTGGGRTRTGFPGGFVMGLGTSLGNPKAGVFAVSILPQFVTATGPVFLSSAALGGVWALVNACWYLLFTWLVHRGRALVTRPAVHRGLGVVTGVVLLVLGVAVAAGA
ncbi:LysE family translocator [Streptomyces sp. NPDC004008]